MTLYLTTSIGMLVNLTLLNVQHGDAVCRPDWSANKHIYDDEILIILLITSYTIRIP